jgi:hypothetical protein
VGTYGSDEGTANEEGEGAPCEERGTAGEGCAEEGEEMEGRRSDEVEVRAMGDARERREGGRGSVARFSFS